jgi:hypothetical protein
MLDREAWRGRIMMIVVANKEVDSRKREDGIVKSLDAALLKLEVLLEDF